MEGMEEQAAIRVCRFHTSPSGMEGVWNMSEETKQLTAVEVRAAFPECVKIADEFRAAFGPGVKLVYARENGREIGVESLPGVALTPAQMALDPLPVEEPKKRKRNGK
jgi:hypothetical protein